MPGRIVFIMCVGIGGPSVGSSSTPCFASSSAISLPWVPLWPFIQVKVVGAVLDLRALVASIMIPAFLVLVHPSSSHFCVYFVSAFMAYCESVLTSSSSCMSEYVRACLIAYSSAVWFDWSYLLGTLTAEF